MPTIENPVGAERIRKHIKRLMLDTEDEGAMMKLLTEDFTHFSAQAEENEASGYIAALLTILYTYVRSSFDGEKENDESTQ